MPVTSIQDVINATGKTIVFINTESSGNNAEILNFQDVSVNNCFVPWCTKAQDFPAHHLQIQDEVGNVLWFIWQSGWNGAVRASQTGFSNDTPPINGIANPGSTLSLAINKVSIRTYNFDTAPPIDPDLPL